jgi:CRP-like cAMP-binding protein
MMAANKAVPGRRKSSVGGGSSAAGNGDAGRFVVNLNDTDARIEQVVKIEERFGKLSAVLEAGDVFGEYMLPQASQRRTYSAIAAPPLQKEAASMLAFRGGGGGGAASAAAAAAAAAAVAKVASMMNGGDEAAENATQAAQAAVLAASSEANSNLNGQAIVELLVIERQAYCAWLMADQAQHNHHRGSVRRGSSVAEKVKGLQQQQEEAPSVSSVQPDHSAAQPRRARELLKMEQCRRVLLRKDAVVRSRAEVELIEEVILRQPFVAQLSAEKVHALSQAVTMVEVDSEEVICHQGDIGDCLYIISRGGINVYVESADSNTSPEADSGKKLDEDNASIDHDEDDVSVSSPHRANTPPNEPPKAAGPIAPARSRRVTAIAPADRRISLGELLSADELAAGNAGSSIRGAAAAAVDDAPPASMTLDDRETDGPKAVIELSVRQAQINDLGQVHIKYGRLVSIQGEGDTFGESSMYTGAPRAATVVAREPTELLLIHKVILTISEQAMIFKFTSLRAQSHRCK